MIDFLVDRKRTAIALLIVLIFAGIFGRINIPIENEPEIIIPVVYVGVGLSGISPEDSERLLLKPIEDEIRSVEGIDELQGCLLYTSPSPRDQRGSRMPSSA